MKKIAMVLATAAILGGGFVPDRAEAFCGDDRFVCGEEATVISAVIVAVYVASVWEEGENRLNLLPVLDYGENGSKVGFRYRIALGSK